MKNCIVINNGKRISITTYVNAWKIIRSNPLDTMYKEGLTTWWAVNGHDLIRQYREGIHDRINQRAMGKCLPVS